MPLRAGLDLPLWPEDAPLPQDRHVPAQVLNALNPPNRSVAMTRPVLTTYLLPDTQTPRPMVIVLPGGGYVRVAEKEGRPVVGFLNAQGYHAASLDYRTLRMHPAPLLDARRAIQMVRARAAAWRVSHVAVLGFSAGGHLAGHVALAWDAPVGLEVDVAVGDRVAQHDARPDAAALAYPVVSASLEPAGTVGRGIFSSCSTFACNGLRRKGEPRPLRHHGSFAVLLGAMDPPHDAEVSLELLAASRSARAAPRPPPLFVWTTTGDEKVPSANAEVLASAVRASSNLAPIELHVFEDLQLRHGTILGRGVAANWTGLWLGWMTRVLPGGLRPSAWLPPKK